MLSAILSMAGPLVVFFIKMFIKNAEAKQKAIKNYYEFISQIDKKSATKVANYLAAEKELERIQLEIREKNEVEPERPVDKAVGKNAGKNGGIGGNYDVPEIIEVDIAVKTRGKYMTPSKQAKGLVVHYTAGRFEKGRQSAINTLNSLAKRGLGCLVMDIDGKIYRAKSQKINDIAYHAGTSAFKGYTGMSRYLMGMEICNAGRLEADGKAWFGLPIPKDEQRDVSKKDNVKAGKYHKYSAAQEKSLINFVLWQLDVNPEFDLDFVIGHDECAPTRKSDPGGSLSMTMPAFRAMIKQRV